MKLKALFELEASLKKHIGILNKDPKKKYEIFGSNNFMGALSLHGFSIDRKNDRDSKPIFLDYEVDEKEQGGIIAFSVNGNTEKLSRITVLNWLEQKFESFKNKDSNDKKMNKAVSLHDKVRGVTIGNFVKGRYRAKDGSLYDSSSLSVDIKGITSEVLNQVAEDLANGFKQENVLVKDCKTNKNYLAKCKRAKIGKS